jgi:hypothetical protein
MSAIENPIMLSEATVIMGHRIPPFAFTEHGILMLASVLNINREAIEYE